MRQPAGLCTTYADCSLYSNGVWILLTCISIQELMLHAEPCLGSKEKLGSAWAILYRFAAVARTNLVFAAMELSYKLMLQFHDYHGVVSLMYLSEAAKPSVMYVAHNADYNGAWALGSAARERYLYSMFNLPISRETRMCATMTFQKQKP